MTEATEHGRVIAVNVEQRGDELAADASAEATPQIPRRPSSSSTACSPPTDIAD